MCQPHIDNSANVRHYVYLLRTLLRWDRSFFEAIGWFWGGEKLIRGVTPLPSCWGQLFLCEHWYSLFPSTPTCGCGNYSWVTQPCPITISWCHPKSRQICLLASGAQNKGWCNRARCLTSRILKCKTQELSSIPKSYLVPSAHKAQSAEEGVLFPSSASQGTAKFIGWYSGKNILTL